MENRTSFAENIYFNAKTNCVKAINRYARAKNRVMDMFLHSNEGDDEKLQPSFKRVHGQPGEVCQIIKANGVTNFISVFSNEDTFSISTTVRYYNIGIVKAKVYTAKVVDGVLYETINDSVGRVDREMQSVENKFIGGKSVISEREQ